MSSRIIRGPDSRLDSGYPDIDPVGDPTVVSPAASARLPGRRRAALAAALAASAAIALTLLPPPPTPAEPAAAPAAVAAPEPEPKAAELAPRAAPPLRLVRSEPPRPRPPAVTAQKPIVTLATRNLPLAYIEGRRERPAELRLAELTTARARMIDATMPLPPQRPDAAPTIELASLGPVPDLRPVHRPVPAAAPLPPAAAADRPRPRPAAEPVAALAPQAAAAIHAAIGAPLARPEGLKVERPAAAAPAPKRVARLEDTPPVRVVTGRAKAPEPARPAAAPARAPQPARVVTAPAPKPVRVITAPAPKPARVVAAPAAPKVTRVQSQQPLRVASVPAPKVTPRREAWGTATSRAAGFSRGNMSLIGVFGSASERHALVRLPNGRVERVGAGDRIQGVQVAAVGADSVRLTRGGRETLLRLPD